MIYIKYIYNQQLLIALRRARVKAAKERHLDQGGRTPGAGRDQEPGSKLQVYR